MADALKVIAVLQSRIGVLTVELAAMQIERDDAVAALIASEQPVAEIEGTDT
jgi:hypothetical protein